jgi:hypothetical protein
MAAQYINVGSPAGLTCQYLAAASIVLSMRPRMALADMAVAAVAVAAAAISVLVGGALTGAPGQLQHSSGRWTVHAMW